MDLKIYTDLLRAFDSAPGATAEERLEEALLSIGGWTQENGETVSAFALAMIKDGHDIGHEWTQRAKEGALALEAERKEKARRDLAKKQLENTQGILTQIQGHLDAGAPLESEDFQNALEDARKELGAVNTSNESHREPLHSFLKSKLELYATREPGGLLGPGLNRFHELAQALDGIQPGFYIVAAEPNIGKTTFSTSLAVDFLQANKKGRALYISLDDPKETVSSAMIANMTYQYFNPRVELRTKRDMVQVNHLKRKIEDPATREAHNLAAQEILNWAGAGRLDIMDATELNKAKDVERAIKDFSREAQGQTLILIDALYNLDVDTQGGKQGIREENIARANLLKRICDVYKVPIFTTAEITKGSEKKGPRDAKNPPTMADIMETGKFAYNANAVFMIYPEDYTEHLNHSSLEQNLILAIVKNKLSSTKGRYSFTFTKAAQHLEPAGTYRGQQDHETGKAAAQALTSKGKPGDEINMVTGEGPDIFSLKKVRAEK